MGNENTNTEEMVNAEDLGFTKEDLADIVEETPSTEGETNSSATPHGEEGKEPNAQGGLEENNGEEPSTEPNTETGTEENHGNLTVALKKERERRREIEKELNALRAKANPVRLSQDELTNIGRWAETQAAQRLGIKKDELETLMYTDEEKYKNFVREQAKIEQIVQNEVAQANELRSSNAAFVQSLASQEDFQTVFQYATEMLNELPRKDSLVIDQAYARIDNGVGTQADFDVITKFYETAKSKLAETKTTTPQTESPLQVAGKMPRANNLNGGATVGEKITADMVIKMVAEGRESELPKEWQDWIADNVG